MQLSLQTRLTAWYSLLLLGGIVLFSVTILWLYWRLGLHQTDENLESLSGMAVNVVAAELAETDSLPQAAAEIDAIIRGRDSAVAVFDGSGTLVRPSPLAAVFRKDTGAVPRTSASTVTLAGGSWRVIVRHGGPSATPFAVAVATPLADILAQWGMLAKACLIGIPFVLALAAAGGWLLGRRGLRPLATMAAQAQAVTARNLESRLTAPSLAPELEALAVSFNHVLDRLGTAITTQRRFMADASHELRTPVSVMRTAADVTLSRPVRQEGEYREALTAVAQQSARLARLVDDMLVLARGDAGGYPVVRSEIDLDVLVRECAAELAPRAADRSIAVQCCTEPVAVTADESLLRRMVVNLLTNALTYTAEGGRVDVHVGRAGEWLEIRVSDSGPGIPEADRDRVFERFVRLDPARGPGGAGLGLSIARWVADLHGGRLELAESGPAGSVFRALLPAHPGDVVPSA